jgi:hypothetical protein|eukprot:1698468-Prymnesium_polylepis.3
MANGAEKEKADSTFVDWSDDDDLDFQLNKVLSEPTSRSASDRSTDGIEAITERLAADFDRKLTAACEKAVERAETRLRASLESVMRDAALTAMESVRTQLRSGNRTRLPPVAEVSAEESDACASRGEAMTFDTTQALFFGGREAVRKEKMKPTGFKATRWRERPNVEARRGVLGVSYTARIIRSGRTISGKARDTLADAEADLRQLLAAAKTTNREPGEHWPGSAV